MVDPNCLVTYPDELIIKIFGYCDVQSLGRLAQTCTRFKEIIYTEDLFWREKSTNVICSNMFSEEMQRRSLPFLSPRERCAVSWRWIEGLNVKTTVERYTRCMPWLALEKDYLFYSKGEMIVRYLRKPNGDVGNKRSTLVRIDPILSIYPHDDDVSKFTINGAEIVTAGRDGTLCRFSKHNFRRVHQRFGAHSSQIGCVDALEDIIITGSRDTLVKVWKGFANYTLLEKVIPLQVRVLSVAIMPSKSNFVVGLPGVLNVHPLMLYDFENALPVANLGSYRNGAGILAIRPECDHTFYACGYDTTVKLWDVRTPQHFVSSWMEPYDNVLYCVQTDHHATVMCGASRSGLVHVWDKRMPSHNFLHVYPEINSPAYSIDFDTSHLYIACDSAVTQFSYL